MKFRYECIKNRSHQQINEFTSSSYSKNNIFVDKLVDYETFDFLCYCCSNILWLSKN